MSLKRSRSRLRAKGYTTGGFVSAYVLGKRIGLDRGFDVYGDHFGWLRGVDAVLVGRLWELWQRYQDPHRLLERRAADTADEALGWIKAQNAGWFAWVHLFDPHGPYAPPPPYDHRFYEGHDPRSSKNRSMDAVSGVPEYMKPSLSGITDLSWVKAQYSGEVAYVDAQIGRLLDVVESAHPNTLVAIVGDHGEGLGEEDEWFRHGDFLYEHDLRVPLALRLPGVLPAAQEVRAPVAAYWIFDTILDYLGDSGPYPNSLRGVIEGGRPPSEMVHAMCLDREANRVERLANPEFVPKWRMAASWAPGVLYVVRESPRMEDRMFLVAGGQASEGGAPSTDALKQSAASILTTGVPVLPELPEGERNLLEALGYVDPVLDTP